MGIRPVRSILKLQTGGNYGLPLPVALVQLARRGSLLRTSVTLRNRRSMKIYALAAFAFFNCAVARANTITASSCAQNDVQSAINSAQTGDTVIVQGSCTVSWSSAVDIPITKGITVQASGSVTITSSIGFTLEPNLLSESRITGFTFTGPSGNPPSTDIFVDGTSVASAYRLDHNTFSNPALSVFINVAGNGPGLIDHNTFTGGSATEAIHVLGMGASSVAGWLDNVSPGGAQMVFIEDNTFNTGTSAVCSAVESYYGARTVFRHNTLNYCQADQHGTAGMIGARWWEIYENTFNNLNQNQCCYVTVRGGSGVIWGNTAIGNNAGDSNGSIDLYEEDSGTWPLAYQIGSGIGGDVDGHNSCGSLNSSPAYVWGNSSNMTVTSQTPTKVILDRDYFSSTSQPASLLREELSTDNCSTTYNYVPYTYPHPLQSGGGSGAPSAPSGLTAVVN